MGEHRCSYPPSTAGKGTTVRHEVFEAGAIFSRASVNRQARRVALTPFVPLSREAGEGDLECGSEASAYAEANASALQTGQRAAPLSHAVGEGLGVRAESGRTLHTANPRSVPLSALSPSPAAAEGERTATPLPRCGRGAGGEGEKACESRTQ